MERGKGRPKKLLEDLPDKWEELLLELGAMGASQEYMAASLEISRDCFYRMKAEEPHFSDTVNRALQRSLIFWERAGMEGMFMGGKDNPFNSTVWIFNMKNRFGWADKTEVRSTSDVNFKKEVDLSKLSEDELRQLAEMQRKSGASEA